MSQLSGMMKRFRGMWRWVEVGEVGSLSLEDTVTSMKMRDCVICRPLANVYSLSEKVLNNIHCANKSKLEAAISINPVLENSP